MKTIETILREEMKQLETIVEEAEKRLKNAPKGHLRITKKRDSVEYYYKDECSKNNNGRYMRKNETNIAQRIAQRDYDICMVKNMTERIKAIERFLDKYKKTGLERINKKINSYRKNLIEVSVMCDRDFIEQWQAVEYIGKSFADDVPEIITERGERVRSKSEKIIADKLYALGIPYRYEYPLVLAFLTE